MSSGNNSGPEWGNYSNGFLTKYSFTCNSHLWENTRFVQFQIKRQRQLLVNILHWIKTMKYEA